MSVEYGYWRITTNIKVKTEFVYFLLRIVGINEKSD